MKNNYHMIINTGLKSHTLKKSLENFNKKA